MRATVEIPGGGSATGTAMVRVGSFERYPEKAETQAVGRALALLGYGTQFCEDLADADAPVDGSPAPDKESRTVVSTNAPSGATQFVAEAKALGFQSSASILEALGVQVPADADSAKRQLQERIKGGHTYERILTTLRAKKAQQDKFEADLRGQPAAPNDRVEVI